MLKMNKRRVNELIPRVIEYIPSSGILIDNEIPNEFKGYVSSFGASIIQSGLLSAVAFFEADDSKSKSDRKVLTKLILKVIYRNKKLEWKEDKTLLNYILENNNKETKEEVINAAIAVKLAIRVFKFTENSEG